MSPSPDKMWNKGRHLRHAFIHFYGFPNHETDEQACKDRSDYLLLGRPAEQGEVGPEDPEWHRYQPEFIEHRQSARQKLRKAFCDNLCNQLKVRKLVALGKQIYPTHLTEPEAICAEEVVIEPDRQLDELTTADVLAGGHRIYYASWDDDVFVGRTARYKDVRIYDPRYNLDGSQKKNAFPEKEFIKPAPSSDIGGRPSERETILSAFDHCVKDGIIKPDMTQKAAAHAVQDYIRLKMPEYWEGDGSKEPGSGYSITTITRHIKPHFNSLKYRDS